MQLPLIEGVKVSANAVRIIRVFIEIANLELVPSEDINNEILYFPEDDPYNRNFLECGIESRYFIMEMGLPFYVILGYFILVIIYLIFALAQRLLKRKVLGKIVNKVRSYLFWNSIIRLYMEVY